MKYGYRHPPIHLIAKMKTFHFYSYRGWFETFIYCGFEFQLSECTKLRS